MKADAQGKMIKYLVTDLGIRILNEDHPDFDSDELAIFENFDNALIHVIEVLCDRVSDLEKKARTK